MSVSVAVSDASPLISLHQIDHLVLLPGLFGSIAAPPAIEVEVAPSVGALPAWVERRYVSVPPGFLRHLDPGEREAIALAIYLRANLLVIDDLPGRHAAEGLGLRVIGTLGLLVRAKHSGLIGEVRPLIDALIAHGLYTSAGLYHRILSLAGETEQLRFVEYGSTCRDFGNTQKRYGYHASSTRITRSHNHEHDPNFHR